DIMHVSAAAPRARALRQLEERGGVQRVERLLAGVAVRRASANRCRMQVGEVARELVDDLERELTPFTVRALPDERLPLSQVAITHSALPRDPESARRTAAIPCAAPRARRGPRA